MAVIATAATITGWLSVRPSAEYVDALFHALADPTRRDILAVVLQDAHSVSDLARRYPISFAAVHKHVGALERAGLVTKTRHGREQHVRGDAATLRTAHRLLDDLEALWRGRIDRMEQVLAGEGGSAAVPVTSVVKKRDARTMTITAHFDAPIDRVWKVWSDPRQLERWWGPPTYPAIVSEHDLTPGGTVTYAMTGPEGDRHGGRGACARSTRRTIWSSRTAWPTPTATRARTHPLSWSASPCPS